MSEEKTEGLSEHAQAVADEISPGTGTAARLWCDPRVSDREMDVEFGKVAAEKFDELYDHLDSAWEIMASATYWDSSERAKWRETAELWHIRWKELLKP